MVQYLIRLDDLCPTNNLSKWERFFDLFDHYDIKPMIAVIPDNKDPGLNICGDFNPVFWQLVRDLQKRNYFIALHGFQHLYVNENSGILKLNKKSEFAGLSLPDQELKINSAVQIFTRENIDSSMFIAPSHTFDRNTLIALNKCSDIHTISDGLIKHPYLKYGFSWIPVQLSEVEAKSSGTWTFNYHPETCTDKAFEKVRDFIHKNHKLFVRPSDLTFKPYTSVDFIAEKYRIYRRLVRDFVKHNLLACKTRFKYQQPL
ncbi:DUF2334 domain-containing protein [Mucilaginibacter xinganensis]|uniref:DUF2334 domain-containing protein n=1 Tax=Mucilaginibacter xinganensis TaxID=1234841 RepID=A0A223NY05_9SPHI|nr:DUF2334 domain-containing protein [Mucilaginibacter xinganensis]ASU34743.1 hypothetical protein MuYL_2856 [Mucilaginibacter xinganensis]